MQIERIEDTKEAIRPEGSLKIELIEAEPEKPSIWKAKPTPDMMGRTSSRELTVKPEAPLPSSEVTIAVSKEIEPKVTARMKELVAQGMEGGEALTQVAKEFGLGGENGGNGGGTRPTIQRGTPIPTPPEVLQETDIAARRGEPATLPTQRTLGPVWGPEEERQWLPRETPIPTPPEVLREADIAARKGEPFEYAAGPATVAAKPAGPLERASRQLTVGPLALPQMPGLTKVTPSMEPVPFTPSEQAYGLRADGTPKGPGFLGPLKKPDGSVSTELSIGVNLGGKETEIPSLVPNLTKPEVDHLLSGGQPTQAIIDKAVGHARKRMAEGKSPFAQEREQVKGGVAQVQESKVAFQMEGLQPGHGKREIQELPLKPGHIPTGAESVPLPGQESIRTLQETTEPKPIIQRNLLELLGVVPTGRKPILGKELTQEEKNRNTNIVSMAKELNLPPNFVEQNYDAFTKALGMRGIPTRNEMMQLLIAAGIGHGVLTAPIATAMGLGTYLGVKEAESLTTQAIKGETPRPLQGRELKEFLGPLDDRQSLIVDTMEFIAPGFLGAKIMSKVKGKASEKLFKKYIDEAWDDYVEKQSKNLLEYKQPLIGGKPGEPPTGEPGIPPGPKPTQKPKLVEPTKPVDTTISLDALEKTPSHAGYVLKRDDIHSPEVVTRAAEIITQNPRKWSKGVVGKADEVLKGGEEAPEVKVEEVKEPEKPVEKPTFKTSEEAQKAIDDLETELEEKYGWDEVKNIPVYPEQYEKMGVEPPKAKIPTEDVARVQSLYQARDKIDRKDLADWHKTVLKDTGLPEEEARGALASLGGGEETGLAVPMTARMLKDFSRDTMDNLGRLYNHFAEQSEPNVPYERTFGKFRWGGTADEPRLQGSATDEDGRRVNWNEGALKKTEAVYNAIAKSQSLKPIDLSRMPRGMPEGKAEKKGLPAPEGKVEEKEPWETIRSDWVEKEVAAKKLKTSASEALEAAHKRMEHRKLVEKAISEDKPVSSEVLADYPDLAKAAESKLEAKTPGTLKIGDAQRIMGTDTVVAQTKTIDGMVYDLFNASKLKDKRGFIRVYDPESGNVVSVTAYPNYDQAEKKYLIDTKAAETQAKVKGAEEKAKKTIEERKEAGEFKKWEKVEGMMEEPPKPERRLLSQDSTPDLEAERQSLLDKSELTQEEADRYERINMELGWRSKDRRVKAKVEEPGFVGKEAETPEFNIGKTGEIHIKLYHGSSIPVDSLKLGPDGGIHLGTKTQAEMRNPKYVYEVRVDAKKFKREQDTGGNWKDKITKAKKAGYEGIIYLNRYEGINRDAYLELLNAGWTGEKLDVLPDREFKKLLPDMQDSYIVFSPDKVKLLPAPEVEKGKGELTLELLESARKKARGDMIGEIENAISSFKNGDVEWAKSLARKAQEQTEADLGLGDTIKPTKEAEHAVDAREREASLEPKYRRTHEKLRGKGEDRNIKAGEFEEGIQPSRSDRTGETGIAEPKRQEVREVEREKEVIPTKTEEFVGQIKLSDFEVIPEKFIPNDLVVDRKAIREKTGKEITIKQNAKEAYLDIMDNIKRFRSLLDCLKA